MQFTPSHTFLHLKRNERTLETRERRRQRGGKITESVAYKKRRQENRHVGHFQVSATRSTAANKRSKPDELPRYPNIPFTFFVH